MARLKVYRVPAILVWLSASPAAAACQTGEPVAVRNGFSIAEELVHSDEKSLRAYVRGFTNGILLSPLLGGSQECVALAYQCLGERSDAQLAAILRKYLTDHPEDWNEGAGAITYNALAAPCFARP
jgi:hypothetical protein